MISLPDPVANAIDSAIQAIYSLQPYADPTVVLGTSSASNSQRNLGRNAEFAALCSHPLRTDIISLLSRLDVRHATETTNVCSLSSFH
jgi:hypothetical protein